MRLNLLTVSGLITLATACGQPQATISVDRSSDNLDGYHKVEVTPIADTQKEDDENSKIESENPETTEANSHKGTLPSAGDDVEPLNNPEVTIQMLPAPKSLNITKTVPIWDALLEHPNTRAFRSADVRDVSMTETETWVATNRGAGMSTDSENNWIFFDSRGNFPSYDTRSVAHCGSKTFIATDKGLATSTDNGKNWTLIVADSADLASNDIKLVRCTGNQVVVLFADGIQLSSDGGASWGAKLGSVEFGEGTSMGIAIDGAIFAFAWGSGGALLSKDSGSTWEKMTKVTGTVKAVSVLGTTIAFGTDQGVTVSSDSGGHWETSPEWSDKWIMYQQISALSINNGAIWAMGTKNNPMASKDGGKTWFRIWIDVNINFALRTSRHERQGKPYRDCQQSRFAHSLQRAD